MDPVVNKESAKSKKDTIEKPRVAQYKFYLLFIFISQTEELTKIDKLYTRMQDLEIVLDGIDRSAATLRHMIDSYSLSTTLLPEFNDANLLSDKTTHRSGKTIPFEQIRIEPFYPYLRSPLWHKYKENQYVEDRSYLEFLAKHCIFVALSQEIT